MEKLYDGIIGLAIGDALGVPMEFRTRQEIEVNPVSTMREYGTHGQPKGVWSDDTSLTLALLDSIIKCKGLNYADIMDKFSSWLMYGDYTATGEVFDVGNATSRAIMSYGRGSTPLECGMVSEYENGNGSLMRILPIAFFLCSHEELSLNAQVQLIHNVSSLTHRHMRSMVGCGIYVLVAKELILGQGTLTDLVERGVHAAFAYYDAMSEPEVAAYERLRNINKFRKLSNEEIKSSGYVIHTLEAAIWCLLNTDSYKDCVLKAVNLGDDTDTVGAVVGGLAGIYYGNKNIPLEWLDTIVNRHYIESLCEMFE
ncbi:ADP-ribosylglycohydrolase family protein [Enterocloster citroniae]|uniref:ADP-ribosylglycohydrolase n=1 Tax=[Clostridium] citroniae WAL-17108 TaxID=742733 RepID=G5HE75_9FIRM|nr:ADP-ribosylglycohydrolase family protein [Enterocloster citroniae]EHF00302.1 hypothetical protein HMPREF9469_00887 [ [[Clostridium] citroniae WAL-17108]MCC3383241.1 ADP-ribosylglycohydrolase [Enterocloster citroniae]